MHGILPLKSILANRHIGTSGECPIYNEGAEDIVHLLFLCHTARELWASLGVHEIIEQAVHADRSGSAVLEYLLQSNNISMPDFDYIDLKETVSVT